MASSPPINPAFVPPDPNDPTLHEVSPAVDDKPLAADHGIIGDLAGALQRYGFGGAYGIPSGAKPEAPKPKPQAAVSSTEGKATLPEQTIEGGGPDYQYSSGVSQGGGGGGSSSSMMAASSRYGGDIEEQKQAAEGEIRARESYGEGVGEKLGQEASQESGLAEESMAQAEATQTQAKTYIDEHHQLIADYANGHIDKDQWWDEKSVPQKIGAVLGAMFAGYAGGPQAAMAYVNNMVDRNLSRQQDEIHRKGAAGEMMNNLLYSFLKTSNSTQEAFDKARAALIDSAKTEVQQASVHFTAPIEVAKIRELMAALDTQRDAALLKATGGTGPAAHPNELEIDEDTAVTDPVTGQSYAIMSPKENLAMTNALTAYARLHSLIQEGRQLLSTRAELAKSPWENKYALAKNILDGRTMMGAAQDAIGKMASARGIPMNIIQNVKDQLPDYGSPSANFTQEKAEQLNRILDDYKANLLEINGAVPAKFTRAAGQGKEAGKWKVYAQLGQPGSPKQPHAPNPQALPQPQHGVSPRVQNAFVPEK